MGDAPDDLRAEWAALGAWLEEHAPITARTLRPGASAADVAAAQERLGMLLPDELALWFTLQGGCGLSFDGEILPGQLPLGLAEALADHRMRTEVAGRSGVGRGPESDDWVADWSTMLVPVGTDTCGGVFVVDVRDHDTYGAIRFHDFENGGEVPVRWASLGRLVGDVRRALADGDVVGDHWQARAHDGVVQWRVIYGATTPTSPWE